jgi:hypothetical protein
MFKESEDEYGYYLDSERDEDENIYDSNLYLIFWPKDGHVGPKHLQIAEYGSEGENRVHLDFGLPILFRLGQFDIRHESGSERKLYLLGNYMDPETKQSVPSEILAAFQNTGITIPAHTPSPISWDLHVVNPFVLLKSPLFRSDDKRWQITIHDQYECYGYVSTNPQDVESLELVSANMTNMYRIWEESKLFDPILKAIQQTANLLRREGRDLPADQYRAWEFSIRKSVEEFYAEADRVRVRIPMYAGNQCR